MVAAFWQSVRCFKEYGWFEGGLVLILPKPPEEEVLLQPEIHRHKTACVCFHPSTFT